MIRVIAIGKKHEDWVTSGIGLYEKRLRRPYNLKWTLLPHSSFEANKALDDESERILSLLDDTAYVVLLDETGKQLNSPALSDLCEWQFTHGREVVFVIGGAYGASKGLCNRADAVGRFQTSILTNSYG